LYSYEAEFIQKLQHQRKKSPCVCRFDISLWAGNQKHNRALPICFVFRYIYYSILNTNGIITTPLYDKRDYFHFPHRHLSWPM
jgi:hypothetical protein